MVDLIDIVLEGFKDAVAWITELFMAGLQSGYESLTAALFGTPTPRTDRGFVFGEPLNTPWPAIRDALVGGEIMLIALLLLVVSVQARHTIRIFNLGSAYAARKTRRTAWLGAILIVTWYWLSTLVLYLVDGFTIALLPALDTLGAIMLDFLATSVYNPALALAFAITGGFAMWTLQALYFIRDLLLYVYVYGMPIALALAYGNVPVVSTIAAGFARRFVPLAVLPLPAAVVFSGYELLYAQGALAPQNAFLKHVVAVSLPVLALYVTWKTFGYATPLTARIVGTAANAALLLGAVATGAYLAGPHVATTAARWGPKAATGHVVAQQTAARATGDDADGRQSRYRRTENDPDQE